MMIKYYPEHHKAIDGPITYSVDHTTAVRRGNDFVAEGRDDLGDKVKIVWMFESAGSGMKPDDLPWSNPRKIIKEE